jgi:hypothetical protein
MFFASRSRTAVLTAAAAAIVAAPLAAGAQTLPPAEQLVERYVEAVGGRAAHERHDHRRLELEMAMPAVGMTMQMEMLQSRPNLTLTRMTIPGMGTMRSGYDGTVAWASDPMSGARIITGDELEQTLRQADFDSGINFARHFPTMETVELTEMGGRACYSVRMVSAGGDEVFNCFDSETALMVGAVMTQASPMGRMEAEMRFEDYREFDGLLMPTVTRTSMMGQEMVMTVTSVSHDPIDPSVFEAPADVRALAQ